MKFLNYLPVYLNDSNELKDEFTSGDIKLKMSIRYNGEDAEYWTNIDCTVYADYKNWIKDDRVFIKYNEMREVFGAYGESNRIINYDDKRIALINPNFVYLTIRDGELIAPDGFCLVLPIEEEKKKSEYIILLDDKEIKYKPDVWKVVSVGGPSPDSEKAFGTDAIPKVNDIIRVRKDRGVPLEASLNKKLEKNYYVVRHNEIMGYEI
jgi:hypothetical protein